MRGTRVKLLLKGVADKSTRRAVKREFYAEKRARAGFSTARPWGPDGMGTGHFKPAHSTHALSRPSVYDELSDKGKRRVINLMSGRKNRFGYPVLGTGSASRLSKPALAAVIADILARHRNVQQFGRVR